MAQCQYDRVRFQSLELTCRLGIALLIQRHLFDGDVALARLLDGGEPFDHHAFLQGFFHFEVVRRHLVARTTVDDDGLGRPQTFCRTRHVDGGVAATVHHDTATQHRLVFTFHRTQYRYRIHDLGGIARWDESTFADVRADREEGCIESAVLHALFDVGDFGVELECHTQIKDALHFRIEHLAWQTILGDAEAHHASCQRTRFLYLNLMPQARQMIGSRQSRWTCADHQHFLAR